MGTAVVFIARVTSPIDAVIVDLERRIAAYRATHAAAQPTLGELMGCAVEDTDFLGDIDRDRPSSPSSRPMPLTLRPGYGRRNMARRGMTCRTR
jgi:hypothetical protein